jgi:hypothetical protein
METPSQTRLTFRFEGGTQTWDNSISMMPPVFSMALLDLFTHWSISGRKRIIQNHS